MYEPTPRQLSTGLHALWGGIVLGADRLDRRLQSRGLPPGLSVLVTIVGWYSLLGAVERRRPHDDEWAGTTADRRADAAFFAMSAAAASTASNYGSSLVRRLLPGRTAMPLARLGPVGGLAASLLISDLVHYTLHRTSHEWGPAWTVHSVHHSPAGLNTWNATRFHPFEQALEGVLEGFVVGLAGFSPTQHLTHSTARATYGQLQHINADVDSGPLDHVFSTPDLHRWHHSEVYAEGDNNYGAVISIWDRIFGTFFRPNRPLDSELGVGRMPDFPQRFLESMLTPFRWGAIKGRNASTWLTPGTNPDLHKRS